MNTNVVVNVSVSIDANNFNLAVKAIRTLLCTMGQQIPVIELDPETGYSTTNGPLTQEQIADITTKLNGQVPECEIITEKKARKQRAPLTEAETQIVKVRFANGRIKAALARGEAPRPQDLETVNGSKPAKVAKKTKRRTPEQLVAGVNALIAQAKAEAKVSKPVEIPEPVSSVNGKLKDAVKAGKYAGKKVVRTEKQATAK